MKKVIIFGLFLLIFCTVAYCQELSRIELTDGSVINGEIISDTDGVYTVNSPSFGEIKIEADKVSKVEAANSLLHDLSVGFVTQEDDSAQPQMDTYKQALMNDPENAAIVTGLAADPQIQELVKDPEIAEAARTGNIQALMRSEKFMNMINRPEIQESLEKLKNKQ